MNAWWRDRTQRERIIIAGGAAILALLAALQLVVSPLIAWRADATRRAETAESNYRLVYRAAALSAPDDQPRVQSDTPIRNALNSAAAARDVPLTFVNALPGGGVELQAGPAQPERIFSMLSNLDAEHGVVVLDADIARAGEDPDRVRIKATLARR